MVMNNKREREIYLAGGCFWGMQAFFDQVEGVLSSVVGYANGHKGAPTYEEVCSQKTGFAETLKLVYDDTLVTLDKLLDCFFMVIDPCSLNKQGEDEGDQYRSGIYYSDPRDREVIVAYMAKIAPAYQQPLVTETAALRNFYPAEEYHQNYLEKNPQGYCHIDLSLFKQVD